MTSTCLQNKLDLLDEEINLAKLSVFDCMLTDASYNKLLSQNKVLELKLQKSQKLLQDGLETVSPPKVPVNLVYITIFYVILLSVIGIFYSSFF